MNAIVSGNDVIPANNPKIMHKNRRDLLFRSVRTAVSAPVVAMLVVAAESAMMSMVGMRHL